ncbi:MAG: CDP-alcohol phosphatidyltransferase family protein [Bdellovibrio sp.]|nr:CDP-alcohol phosphatidyltransferase family protein [Methylotenera sp.]
MAEKESNRRPLATRSAKWANWLSAILVKSKISPNQISVLSIAPALAGAWLLLSSPLSAGMLVLSAVCIQLRLLCNMLDGMVAIEGGKQSKVGVLYNEIPDRIADSLFIVALGYAIFLPWLGWLGALLAAKTAYVRVLGGANGLAQNFAGPMAKPHRMFVLTLGCLIGAAEVHFNGSNYALTVAAYIIAIGSGITCIARMLAVARQLKAQ